MLKKIVGSVVFLAVFAVLFSYLNNPVIWNENLEWHAVATDQVFKNEYRDKYDILFIGSSHANCTFYPRLLWEEYGFASHILSSSAQEIYVAEYFLKDSLNVQQNVDVVVLEVFGATIGTTYGSLNGQSSVMSSYSMTPFSLNKLETLVTHLNDVPIVKRILPLLPLVSYHENWKILTLDNFKPINHEKYKYNFGAQLNKNIADDLTQPEINKTEVADFHEGSKDSLINIIDFCKNNNIELVLVVSPYVIDEQSQKVMNSVEVIANQYNVPFINYNHLYDEIDIDFSTDFFDYQHLNDLGKEKVTNHLGEFLYENYQIPDRRGDTGFDDFDLAEQREYFFGK